MYYCFLRKKSVYLCLLYNICNIKIYTIVFFVFLFFIFFFIKCKCNMSMTFREEMFLLLPTHNKSKRQ